MSRATTTSRALFMSVVATLLGGLIVVSGQNPPAGTAAQSLPLRESELIAQGRPLPDYDVRNGSAGAPAAMTAAQLRSTADLRRQVGDATTVQFDSRSGGVSQVFQPAGYTDGPPGRPAICNPEPLPRRACGPVRAVGSRSAEFTTVTEDLDGRTGVTHIYLEQRMSGLRVFGSVIKGHDPMAPAVGSRLKVITTRRARISPTRRRLAEDALQVALRSSLPDVLAKVAAQQAPAALPPGSSLVAVGSPYRFPQLSIAERGQDRVDDLRARTVRQAIEVRQVVFPTAEGPVLAWEVEVDAPTARPTTCSSWTPSPEHSCIARIRLGLQWTFHALVFPKSPDASAATLLAHSPAILSPHRSAGVMGRRRWGTTCKRTAQPAPAISFFPSRMRGARSV